MVLFVALVGVGWLLSRALCAKLLFGVGACDGVVCADVGSGESFMKLAELLLNIRSASVMPPFRRVAVPGPVLVEVALEPLT